MRPPGDPGVPLGVGDRVRLTHPEFDNYRRGQVGKVLRVEVHEFRPRRLQKYGEPEPERPPPRWWVDVQYADGSIQLLWVEEVTREER